MHLHFMVLLLSIHLIFSELVAMWVYITQPLDMKIKKKLEIRNSFVKTYANEL